MLQGILDLAVADDPVRKDPAKSPVVRVSVQSASEIRVWEDRIVTCLIDAHPDSLRALPELAVSCRLREGELFGIALEDFDFDSTARSSVRYEARRGIRIRLAEK